MFIAALFLVTKYLGNNPNACYWVNKRIVAHLCNWILLLSIKNEQITITNSYVDECQPHYAEHKKADTKENILVWCDLYGDWK